jgi:hypothetical protein
MKTSAPGEVKPTPEGASVVMPMLVCLDPDAEVLTRYFSERLDHR